MSGDDVRSSEEPGARKMMPVGAETARPEGGDGVANGSHPEVNWVGQQHLMWGYCGRAAAAENAGPAAAAPTRKPRPTPPAARRVAPPRRPRNLVVRIGPGHRAEPVETPAKAA